MFMALVNSLVVLFYCCATADILTKLLQQCFLFFIVVPWLYLGNSQVSVYRTIGPTLVLVGWDRISFDCCLVHRGSTDDLLLLQISSCVVWQTRDLHLSRNTLYLLRPRLCFFIVLKRGLFVNHGDSLTC